MDKKTGENIENIPSFYIKAQTIPEAYWRALRTVHYHGFDRRTQYDRMDTEGFIDPPGKDASVLIDIEQPFMQPRHTRPLTCEIGKVIAEYLGVKDHLVVPYEKLFEMAKQARKTNRKFSATIWPYTYYKRLTDYPCSDGTTLNQLELCLNLLAENPLSRRAVAITSVPEIDLYNEADQPCLREVQFRAVEFTQPEDEKRKFRFAMGLRWRSRDGPKASPDNIIGLTNLQARLAKKLGEKTGWEVIPGAVHDYTESFHIYGQDYVTTGGKFTGDEFFKKFPTAESYVASCAEFWPLERVVENVVAQLEELKTETTWNFPASSIELIERLKEDFTTGRFVP